MISKYSFIVLITLSNLSGQREINIKSLVNIDKTYRIKGQQKPADGIVFDFKKEKKVKIGRLKNGKKVGVWIEWHPNERRLQETYKNGLLDGHVSLFYKNGQKEWRHTYNNGILEGNYTRWHQNGQRTTDGFFENGVPVGIWTWRDKEGNIIKKETFKKRAKGFLSGFTEYIDVEIVH